MSEDEGEKKIGERERERERAVHWKRGKKQAVLEDFKENIKKAERRMMKKSEK